jgi:flagellar FliJ protein
MFHVKQELAESLSVVVEAQQERKIVEKLREKQFAEYTYEQQLEEQKQLDEFGNRALFS